MIKISIDAMGGDHGPPVVIPALAALIDIALLWPREVKVSR